ncbi:helix-turn-helix domain-containing protein [Chromobacterium sp. CV08]|uniref:helix-turn-helix domain-containing protein n=1 Tax=Chromobacterium sp. CV08 TaxID=3133274 RepID=UPI003DA9FDFD
MNVQSMQALQHKCVYGFNTSARQVNTIVFGEVATMLYMNTYGERVRARRVELGMSQGELAKLIGAKNQSTIGNIENRNGSSRYTLELSRALRVNYEWLETGEGEKEPPLQLAPSIGTVDTTIAKNLDELAQAVGGMDTDQLHAFIAKALEYAANKKAS